MRWLALVFLFTFGMLHADIEWGTEVRAAYYSPQSHASSRACVNGGFSGEVELSQRFSKNWLLWENANRFSKNGKSRHSGTRRHMHIMPLSFGIKYLINCCDTFRPYIGIGPSYTFFDTENYRHHRKAHHSKSGLGFVTKFGAYIDLKNDFFLDVFVDYYAVRMHFASKHVMNTRHASLGGIHFGFGIGYMF
jgi:outer membrane protein W